MSFPAGTCVFFWDGKGQTVRGTVERISRAADGTVFLDVKEDGGRTVSMPAASVTKETK
ncbi:hypothetical protein DFH07DRAFT_847404 [Mycena maculata]|uniref:Uncharacterized protein n=1 Tax=Mycena maculata TaxID=230809 RepID=A0AAD7HYX9_9AGAR|nr:hypothetical protein DFH07DRAFT_847404 [Mycena maculata]